MGYGLFAKRGTGNQTTKVNYTETRYTSLLSTYGTKRFNIRTASGNGTNNCVRYGLVSSSNKPDSNAYFGFRTGSDQQNCYFGTFISTVDTKYFYNENNTTSTSSSRTFNKDYTTFNTWSGCTKLSAAIIIQTMTNLIVNHEIYISSKTSNNFTSKLTSLMNFRVIGTVTYFDMLDDYAMISKEGTVALKSGSLLYRPIPERRTNFKTVYANSKQNSYITFPELKDFNDYTRYNLGLYQNPYDKNITISQNIGTWTYGPHEVYQVVSVTDNSQLTMGLTTVGWGGALTYGDNDYVTKISNNNSTVYSWYIITRCTNGAKVSWTMPNGAIGNEVNFIWPDQKASNYTTMSGSYFTMQTVRYSTEDTLTSTIDMRYSWINHNLNM